MNAIMQGAAARTWATVHLGQIQHNVREIRACLPPQTALMAVVKADGYGHGAVPAAKAAIAAGAEALAVSTYEEAVSLRNAGIASPILVLSPILPEEIDGAAALGLELTVFQASWLREMRARKTTGHRIRVHIKMDTGMGRLGLSRRDEWDEMIPLLQADDIEVAGVYTHFAAANRADASYCCEQFARFREMRQWLEEAGFRGVRAHCANSAAAIRFPEFALDMVRVGASLFGILPCDDEVARRLSVHLQPTLSLTTTILHVKQLSRGQTVSYDQSYTASGDEWIATLPIGYADGWFRGYSGFYVLANGKPALIVGNICMNQTMIRLPHYMPVGTRVTLLGADGEAAITLDDLAAHLGTIPQQVLALLSPRLPRIYEEGENIAGGGRYE